MHTRDGRFRWRQRFMWLALSGTLLLTGCDDTLRTTVENGIITSSTSFLSSLFQALLQVAQDTGTS